MGWDWHSCWGFPEGSDESWDPKSQGLQRGNVSCGNRKGLRDHKRKKVLSFSVGLEEGHRSKQTGLGRAGGVNQILALDQQGWGRSAGALSPMPPFVVCFKSALLKQSGC